MNFNFISAKSAQKIMNYVFIFSGVLTLAILIIILGYIIMNGIHVLSPEFIFGEVIDSGRAGGIFPMIVSSLYVTFISTLIATPLGVGAAIYISEYSKNGTISRIIRFGAETIASIPSIVFGLFGLSFFVVFLGLGWSILSGGLVLAIMAIPTIFQIAEVSISSVPDTYKEASLGLGATKWQTIYKVILPAALPGIITGIIFGMTRAISEAAAVMYAVGSATSIPVSMFDPGRPLPLHLYVLATEGVSMPNAYGTAAVLVIIVLVMTFLTHYFTTKYQKKMTGN
ncbi:MAG: phosphate ABC transporter permease PstA [Methanobrevibacter sp.]|uniref:phosphate ABC transporter permease PstA n=1 Tax=Methanobrevibacter sp. TaxID=66852 RepID=UPI003F036918